MTVAVQTPISSYTGNGVTTAFSFGYYVAASGDLVVMVDGVVKALTTDYTLTGIGSGSGGTCTFVTAPASGAAVVLYRDTDLLRDTDYQDNGDLLAAILNGDFDRIWLALQETITGAKLSPRAVRAPVGETLNELPEATTRAGKILSFNASTGQPEAVAPTSGTATDLAIQLASNANGDGASMIGVQDAGNVFAGDNVEEVLAEIDAKQFGEYVFPSMTTAQIQSIIDSAATNKYPVWFAPGTYTITASLSVPNNSYLVGPSGYGSGVAAGGATIVASPINTFPIFINATADAADPRNVTIKQLRIGLGSRGIDINATGSGVIQSWTIEDVWIESCSGTAVYANQLFINNTLRRVVISACGRGFYGVAANTNLNRFENCEFIELDGTSVEIQGGEANVFKGCRFEARKTSGATGGNVLRIHSGKANSFENCYFENTYRTILAETSSTNTTAFKNCRFSGEENEVAPAGFKTEIFNSDGIVQFDGNEFATGFGGGTASIQLTGINRNLATQSTNVWHSNDENRIAVGTKKVTFATSGTVFDLFTFTRASGAAGGTNRQTVSGWITVVVEAQDAGFNLMTSRVPITVRGFSNTTMVITLGTAQTANENASGATLVLATKAGATSTSVTLTATYTNAGLANAEISAYLDVMPSRFSTMGPIIVSPVLA